MGLLYDVTYPHSRSQDRAVPWPYLERLARDQRNVGATATCVNGEKTTLRLADGRWIEGPTRHQG